MYKIRSIVWSLIAALILCSGIGQASQVLVMPTADPIGSGMLEAGYRLHGGVHTVRLDVGVLPNLSVGVRQEIGGKLYGAVKAVLAEETQDWPGLALGGEFGSGRQDLYAVVSKQLAAPQLRAHLAYGLGRYSRGMAGLTLMLNPVKVDNVPTTSLFVEYDGKGLGGGLTAQFSPELAVQVGMTLEQGMSLGVNYKLTF